MQSVQKVLLRFFSFSLLFAPFVFTLCYLNMFWVNVMHVLNMLRLLGVRNMSQAMLCALWSIHITWKVMSAKCAQVSLILKICGANGKLGEKIVGVLLY
jgi:hypothetical protein